MSLSRREQLLAPTPDSPEAGQAAAPLPADPLASGFSIQVTDDGTWLLHDCGNRLGISQSMTEPQLRWCVTAHRCGPPESQWHIGTNWRPDQWEATISPARLARNRSTRGVRITRPPIGEPRPPHRGQRPRGGGRAETA